MIGAFIISTLFHVIVGRCLNMLQGLVIAR